MRKLLAIAALALLAGAPLALAQAPSPLPGPVPAAPAPADDGKCKEAVTAKSRSTARLSDAAREQRAKDNATRKWSQEVRKTLGWRYSFWRSAADKQVACKGTPKSKQCTVTARPCRFL
jgi:hypothetical protein